MRKHIRDHIHQILLFYYNDVQKDLQFLQHQRTLPLEHRKIELDDEDLGKDIFQLKCQAADTNESIEQILKIKTID